MWAKIITIKRTKDLNYFSLCSLNLFNTWVSQFELNSWNKLTFPSYSNLLRCTCISHNIRENCWNIDKILCSQKSNLKEVMCRLWEFPPTPTFFLLEANYRSEYSLESGYLVILTQCWSAPFICADSNKNIYFFFSQKSEITVLPILHQMIPVDAEVYIRSLSRASWDVRGIQTAVPCD